jgi:hypothetical protein
MALCDVEPRYPVRGERRQLAGLRDAVMIGVPPEPEVVPQGVRSVDDVVQRSRCPGEFVTNPTMGGTSGPPSMRDAITGAVTTSPRICARSSRDGMCHRDRAEQAGEKS